MPEHDANVPPAARRGKIDEAMRALNMGQPAKARVLLDSLVAQDSRHAQAHYLLGIACHMQGEFAAAIDAFRRAVELAPQDAAACTGLGIALHDHGEHDQALVKLRHACELAPDVPAYWFNLGRALMADRSDPLQARAAFARTLERDPEHLLAHMGMADTHLLTGDIEQAVWHYRHVLARNPDHAKAWHALADIKTVRLTQADVVAIEEALQNAAYGSSDCIALGFALAKAQEDQGAYADAFNTLQMANAAKRATIEWDAAAERDRLLAVERAFASPRATHDDSRLGEGVIFIVSLPRSGSTLVEQIIASHPHVEGTGEITILGDLIEEESLRRGKPYPQWVAEVDPSDWARLGHAYLERSRQYGLDARRFTDKNLLNWRFAGAAHAMLPGARFIHVQRDALETCLACFRQLFRKGNYFTYDLAEMADYLLACRRLCAHWQGQLPDAWLTLVYEQLVGEPDERIRQILDFCGLPDDPACHASHATSRVVRTASAAQVRQPIRRDTARAARYGAALEPLRRHLQAADE